MANIFIIDDEPTILSILEELLSDEGHTVFPASNGKSGLQQIQQAEQPDLVIVDLRMPGMTGKEIIDHLRSDPKTAEVPVMLLTGTVPESDEFPAPGSYQAVVQKPFDLLEVIRAVERLVS